MQQYQIGSVVKIKTIYNDEFQGEVFSYDPASNCIVLQATAFANKNCELSFNDKVSSAHNSSAPVHEAKHRDFFFVNGNNVKDCEVISSPSAAAIAASAAGAHQLPAISMERVKQREYKAVHKIKSEISKFNQGVSPEAQKIFNALSKTMPVRWRVDHSILVMEDVIIKPPYTPNEVSGPHAAAVSQVRKVLEGERKKFVK